MTRLILALPVALAALAPADAARAGGADRPIAEIVTFRLAPGVTDPAFLDAARATGALLATEPGFLSRRLSKGADGAWTDHVAWTSLAEAQAAATRIMTAPEAQPFLVAIDPASIVMRHEPILFAME
jgi:predicted component of type VI protein secretion system